MQIKSKCCDGTLSSIFGGIEIYFNALIASLDLESGLLNLGFWGVFFFIGFCWFVLVFFLNLFVFLETSAEYWVL